MDLGTFDTTGFANGVDTITVTVTDQSSQPLPSATAARAYAAENIAKLPGPCHSLFETHAWRVEVSSELKALHEEVRRRLL